jgi:Mg2+/Co2+ transporter CorB
MEHLETIPEPGTQLMLVDHPVEIVKITGNRVKTVLIRPCAATTELDNNA